MKNYTGVNSNEEICHLMLAAIAVKQCFAVKISADEFLEFNQNGHVDDFAIHGKNGMFRMTVDPHRR